MDSLGRSPGALPSRGLVFQLVCHFHRYGAYSSKSTLSPKTESCFQDGTCSVCFLLQNHRVSQDKVIGVRLGGMGARCGSGEEDLAESANHKAEKR